MSAVSVPNRARGMLARLGILVVTVVFLSGVSTASFAGWSAAVSTTGSAATASASISSSGVAALSQHVYTTATATAPVIRPVVLSNSGTIPLPLAGLAIASTGTLAGAAVSVKIWVRSGTSCPTTVPAAGAVSTTLASGMTSLAQLGAIPAAGSLALCVATSLTASPSTVAGTSITSTVTFSGAVSANWTFSDAPQVFTQSVTTIAAPTITTCTPGTRWIIVYTYDTAIISWSPVAGATSYRLYKNGVQFLDTSATTLTANGSTAYITSNTTFTVAAISGSTVSAPSNPLTLTTQDPISNFGGNNVYCGAIG